MPLVRIDNVAGKPASFRAEISQGIQDAMTATFNVKEDDRFQVISEHTPGTAIVHAPSYVGIKYSDELTIVQITCNDTRTLDQKKLYSPPLQIIYLPTLACAARILS